MLWSFICWDMAILVCLWPGSGYLMVYFWARCKWSIIALLTKNKRQSEKYQIPVSHFLMVLSDLVHTLIEWDKWVVFWLDWSITDFTDCLQIRQLRLTGFKDQSMQVYFLLFIKFDNIKLNPAYLMSTQNLTVNRFINLTLNPQLWLMEVFIIKEWGKNGKK